MTALLPAPDPATTTEPSRGTGSRVVGVLLSVVLVLVIVAAAMAAGLGMVSGDKTFAVLPIVAVVALGLGLLALTRYSGFVLLLLALRPSLDLLKLSGDTAGTTTGNTAAARGLDPSSLVAVLFLVASLLWMAARIRSGKSVPPSRLALAGIVFILAAVVSTTGSLVPQASALETMRLTSVIMMFLVLEQMIDSEKAMKRVIGACFIGLAFPLLYTVVLIVIGEPPSEAKGSFSRLTGPFNQSNTFARYLAFMIVFGVAIYPYLKPRLKALMFPTLALSGVFLCLTLTRTAIGGAVLGIVVVALAQKRKGMLAGFVLVSLVALLALPGLATRFGTLGAEEEAGGSPTGNTLEWRFRYWTRVLPLADQNPVTGIGLNATQYQTEAAKQPHNDFIRAYVETGWVGLLAFGALVVALIGNGITALRRAGPGTWAQAVGAGALGCSLAFLLEIVAANVMTNVVSLWYLMAFSAAAAYVARSGGRGSAGTQQLEATLVEKSELSGKDA